MKENFRYFQCSRCKCIQIAEIPSDIGRFYPSDYYSFNRDEGQEYLQKPLSFFKKIQSDYLSGKGGGIIGPVLSMGYRAPQLYKWIRNLKLKEQEAILDIGSGTGLTLKKMFQLGYRNLTGVDPFIKQDYHFSEGLRIYKLDPLHMNDTVKFDVIMMHHSFEHMEFEQEVLSKACKLLKPGGRILIRIPIVSKPLFDLYGSSLVSLDAPRHLYIHSVESMEIICRKTNLRIDAVEYDADESSFWASEQYKKDICLFAENSYGVSREKSIFSKKQILQYRKDIAQLNKEKGSDTAAFYISKN